MKPKRKPKPAAKPGAPQKKLTARERLALAKKRAQQRAAAAKKKAARPAPAPKGKTPAKGKPAQPKPRTVAA